MSKEEQNEIFDKANITTNEKNMIDLYYLRTR